MIPLRFTFSFVTSLIFSFSISARAQVLYVGDSHTAGYFGSALVAQLQDWSGNLGIDRYAVCGSSTITWSHNQICSVSGDCPYTYGYRWPEANGQPAHSYPFNSAEPDPMPEPRGLSGFAGLAKDPKYQAYIIALGTNDAIITKCTMLPDPEERQLHIRKGSLAAAVKGILDGIPKSNPTKTCVWVGPPAYTAGAIVRNCGSTDNYQKWVASLKSFVEASPQKCKFVENPLKPAGSNVHFSNKIADAAAKVIATEIEKVSPHGRVRGSAEPVPAPTPPVAMPPRRDQRRGGSLSK